MAERTPPVSITQHKDVAIVEFTSNRILDEANIEEISQALVALIEQHDRPKLLLDFANVQHMSSAALGKLIDANHRIRKRSGQLRLANIRSEIHEVFVITRLDQVFRILPTREAALGSFTP